MKNNDPHRYDDIIDLPHHVSDTHPPMSRLNRAAQFAPFAALTGMEETMEETARLSELRATEPTGVPFYDDLPTWEEE